MEKNEFNFCPDCGSGKIQTLLNGRKWFCPECGFELFNNVASAVGVILLNENGEAFFERRAKDPQKNFLALPGGFCEPDEDAEICARRECMEEIGVKIGPIKFVGAFPNSYCYKKILYKTCDIFFEAEFPSDAEFKFQQSEVNGFEWRKINSAEEIEKIPLAFDSAKRALLVRLEMQKKSEEKK
jgi:8-oxo-dGTP pyrophosphatase MutT (NUDIX family)